MNINSIMVVCIGNICRSPIGEELLKIALQDSNISVHSSGIQAVLGSKAHEFSRQIMQKNGYSIDKHIAKQINLDMARTADLILVMSNGQKREIEKRYPATCGKVMRLGHWDNYDIADPLGKDFATFENAYTLIKDSVQQWTEKLLK